MEAQTNFNLVEFLDNELKSLDAVEDLLEKLGKEYEEKQARV
jgi:hypothetical protein